MRDPAPARTLLDILDTTVGAHPDAAALDAAGTVHTYRTLSERVRALGDRLARLGVGRGDRVGVRVPSGTADLYVAVLGVLGAGAAYVPVDVDDPDERAETGPCSWATSFRRTAPPSTPACCRKLLRERLPQALVPVLGVVSDLPARTSGKVDRKALPWPLPTLADDGDGEDGEPPSDGTAAWLSERWRAVLGVTPKTGSDFFALGGTSLTAASLVSLLRERYPKASVADVYHFPVLRRLAERLDESGSRTSSARKYVPRLAAPRSSSSS
ncbi:AMP-binding protein [Streptomyces sp. NPDC088810]|uniref:AMP-binding protein n=1 Tax=Streptomyces sp. NPDC088810 TaxID=3365904 RepID=UPI00381D43DC